MNQRGVVLVGACGLWVLGTVLSAQQPHRGDLRLLDAVKRRDQKAFTTLLRAKADVNAAQPDGATALAWAVYLGQNSMAEALLNAGAKANTTDEYGETPVTLAAANGDAQLVERLIAAGGSARAARWNGESAVMIAAGAGSLASVKQLVLHGADINVADPVKNQTPLMWAAAEAHSDVVAGLVEMGADVNATSKGGFTPLLFSITKNDQASIKTLLKAGAKPNVTLASGSTPLMVAMQYHYTDAALLLIEAGADFNVKDRAGNTLLHLAAQQGDLKLVNELLARKVDPNVRTPKSAAPANARGGGGGFGRGGGAGDQTPLLVAAKADHMDVMKALIAAGADPTVKAQDGSTLLLAAASGARLPTVKYVFEELDKNMDVATTSGNTPMHLAVVLAGRTEPECLEVVKYLADHGAKLDEKNAAGRTPISSADNIPFDTLVKYLAETLRARGVTPQIKPKYY
ncbi:MAG TPA: ankyrin repeat domain-containing protein [Vicinamibacterales bacterium]|nr:ankyrin repeat domain-containing protein [Vicinamibacterales bacterium]